MAKAQRSSSGSGVGGTPQGDEHIFLRLKAVEGQGDTAVDCGVLTEGKEIQLGDDKEGLADQSFHQREGLGETEGSRLKENF